MEINLKRKQEIDETIDLVISEDEKLLTQSRKNMLLMYSRMVDKKFKSNLLIDQIDKSLFGSVQDDNILFTLEQKEILNKVISRGNYILCAPTSFGKTMLMREALFRGDFTNALLIFPKNAILLENLLKILKLNILNVEVYTNPDLDELHIDSSKKNIFLMTQERAFNLLYYYEDKLPCFDFLFCDEFYQSEPSISTSIESKRRFRIYRHAFLRFCTKFPNSTKLLASPNLVKYESIDNRLSKIDIIFEELNYYSFEYVRRNEHCDFNTDMVNLIDSNKQTLIYIPSKSHIYELFNNKNNFKHISEKVDDSFLIPLKNEYEIDNDSSWYFALKRGIALHTADLPNFIQQYIVNLYNRKIIHTIFCTSTLTEGVNLDTERVIIESEKINDNLTLNKIDIINAKGRTPRIPFSVIGEVIYANKEVYDISNSEIEQNYEEYEVEDIVQTDDVLLTEDEKEIKNEIIENQIIEHNLMQRVPFVKKENLLKLYKSLFNFKEKGIELDKYIDQENLKIKNKNSNAEFDLNMYSKITYEEFLDFLKKIVENPIGKGLWINENSNYLLTLDFFYKELKLGGYVNTLKMRSPLNLKNWYYITQMVSIWRSYLIGNIDSINCNRRFSNLEFKLTLGSYTRTMFQFNIPLFFTSLEAAMNILEPDLNLNFKKIIKLLEGNGDNNYWKLLDELCLPSSFIYGKQAKEIFGKCKTFEDVKNQYLKNKDKINDNLIKDFFKVLN